MYYFSIDTITKAYSELQDKIPSKFVGLLSIFKNINSNNLQANMTYKISSAQIGNCLNDIMYLKEEDNIVSNSSLYVRFSLEWDDYVEENMFANKVNIYPFLVFLYKFFPFEEQPSVEVLIQKSALEYHISISSILKWFYKGDFNVAFASECVKRTELKEKLKIQYSTLTFDSSYSVKAKASELSRAPFIQTLYAGMDSVKCLLISKINLDTLYPAFNALNKNIKEDCLPLQLIYFGTPGSGKSYKVQQSLEGVSDDNVFRTTFHPDSDYASFVGCYKPIMLQQNKIALTENELKGKLKEYLSDGLPCPVLRFSMFYPEVGDIKSSTRKAWLTSLGSKESMDTEIQKGVVCGKALLKGSSSSEISYSFIPQVFTNAYVQAWKNQVEATKQGLEQAEKVFLVIEEINRGNCAQIFGDLFQLLDRNEDGTSTYKIRADKDLADYLTKELGENHDAIAGGNLQLPANLHIIATMNTSDQSLFPMDSAFKRRWDWEYVPIDYNENTASGKFDITIGDKKYRWVDFLKAVNARILSATDSEDKQMGNFFIKHSVEEMELKSKVMFYLWHEVCKDEYHTKNNFFRSLQDKEETEFSFNELHEENGTNIIVGFMQYLDVNPLEENPLQEEAVAPIDTNEENAEE